MSKDQWHNYCTPISSRESTNLAIEIISQSPPTRAVDRTTVISGLRCPSSKAKQKGEEVMVYHINKMGFCMPGGKAKFPIMGIGGPIYIDSLKRLHPRL